LRGEVYTGFCEESEGVRSCRISRNKRGKNIKMDLKETGFECVVWIDPAHDREK